MVLSDGTAARLEAYRARGCEVIGPEVEAHPAEGAHGEAADWICVIVLPDGEEMKGRGLSAEEEARHPSRAPTAPPSSGCSGTRAPLRAAGPAWP